MPSRGPRRAPGPLRAPPGRCRARGGAQGGLQGARGPATALKGEPESIREKSRLGLSVTESGVSSGDQESFKTMVYSRPDGTGSGLPLYHKWTTDIPNCSPGHKRVVEFPIYLLNTLFARGLQQWHNTHSGGVSQDIILTTHISSHAVDSTKYETQFRWRIIPFHHGETRPVKVYGHCFELPMYPKPAGSRVT